MNNSVILTIFGGMKRMLLHILFWVAYLTQDSLLAFLWDGSTLQQLSMHERIWMAIDLCTILAIPKILFTYLVLYVILDRILRRNDRLFLNICYFIFAFIATILVIRTIDVYFVYPNIYRRSSGTVPFFSPFGILFACIDLGFVSGAAIALRQTRLQFAGKDLEKQLIKEKLETELKFLKNQTNPHFLFNTLNNIYALARKKSDKTPDVVMKLSKILRFMLYEAGKEFITIGEEVKLIEDYIELEKIRYSERLNVTVKKEIDNIGQPVSPLLLLPFVENAFKHGVSETFFDSMINIEITVAKGHLVFLIENTKEEGAVAPPYCMQIGLENTRRQLELMYGEYEMKIDNQPKAFRILLTVNLNKYEKISVHHRGR